VSGLGCKVSGFGIRVVGAGLGLCSAGTEVMAALPPVRWNIFDTLVVAVCWIGLLDKDIPAMNLIRFLRVFRVIKVQGSASQRWRRNETRVRVCVRACEAR